MYIGFYFANRSIANWFTQRNIPYDYLRKVYLKYRQDIIPAIDCEDKTKTTRKLNATDLYSIMVMWSFGILVAMVLFIFEIVLKLK